MTVYFVRLMTLLVEHEYDCLIVRGFKTSETKKTLHLKSMRGRYVVLYDSKVPAVGTHSEGRLPQTGHLVDQLRQHWSDMSDVMLNSQWPEGFNQSDGCAWTLVLVGETERECCLLVLNPVTSTQ